MIEGNDLPINIEQLMQKIRDEVAKRHNLIPLGDAMSTLISDGSGDATVSYIEALLNDADSYSQVPTEFPAKFNRFPFNLSKGLQKLFLKLYGFLFKKQRVVNSSLSQALRESLTLNRRLIDRVNALQQQLDGIGKHVTETDECLREMGGHVSATNERLSEMVNRLVSAEGRLAEMWHHFNTVGERLTEIGDRVTSSEGQLSELDYHLSGTNERLSGTNERLTQIGARLTSTEQNLSEMTTNLGNRLTAIDERYLRNDSYLKSDLSQQKRLVTLFLEEARQRLPESFNQEQLQTFLNEDQHLLDAFYVAFEEQFRGSREDIFSRLKVYLPLIEEVNIGKPDSPILDIGCGRGEWLELLQDLGYVAQGLDINRLMIEQCRTSGLEVIEGDALSYLRTLPDASLGAVTGFHVIEHLPFEVLVKLVDETVRVLKSGGLVIFETPNPENILVGSHTFYIDPTHRKPLPSSMLKVVVESRGLHHVSIMNLHPYPEKIRLSGSVLAERFNEYFYSSQDYALIGYKL